MQTHPGISPLELNPPYIRERIFIIKTQNNPLKVTLLN